MSGSLLGAQVQDSTTTTGTGAITLANSLQAGLPANTTLFGATFAPAAVFPVVNVFYAIFDGTGNNEYGFGTLTSATNLTRDFVVLTQVAGSVPAGIQSPACTQINFAAGTKQVYSNASLFAQTVALWARIPDFVNGGDGGLTEDLMSGSFAGTLTDGGTGTVAVTIRYKVSSAGIVSFQLPAATATGTGVTMAITGIPGFLCNVLAEAVPCYVFGSSSGAITVPGLATLAGGATPQATGTLTFQQYSVVATGFTTVFTTAVAKGWSGNQAIHYPLF